MPATLEKTPLHDWHAEHGGRLVDFAGWSMPVQYTSIVKEHNATRNAVGLFDISHMGRLRFDGPGAESLLDGLTTRRTAGMKPGTIRYSLVTRDDGGILDDVLVYHLVDTAGQPYWLMVVNAGNREKIVGWIEPRLAEAQDVAFSDITSRTAMIAVQGPAALRLAADVLQYDPAGLKYYRGEETRIAGNEVIVSRTGYTGEDGCEIILPADAALDVWRDLLRRGEPLGAAAVGLGARDTLRLEAAMPLYGHELSETIDPYQAGLAFAVDLEDRQFPGRDALARLEDDPTRPQRVGLELDGRRVARQGYSISAGDDIVGEITSGTFSPTFDRPIAMGTIAPQHTAAGTELTIDIRGRAETARVAALPFYRRKK